MRPKRFRLDAPCFPVSSSHPNPTNPIPLTVLLTWNTHSTTHESQRLAASVTMDYDSHSRTSNLYSPYFEHGMDTNETGTRPDAQAPLESLSTSTMDIVGTFSFQLEHRQPSEPWPSIASPPRALNEEFDCDTESPLFSLVQVVSEVSAGNAPPEAYHKSYIPQDLVDHKPTVDLLRVLAPALAPDPFFLNGGLESPMLKTHRRDSSPISRAFRSENTCALSGSPLRPYSGTNRNPKTPEPHWENMYLPGIASLPSPEFVNLSPSSSHGSTLTPFHTSPPSLTAKIGPKLDDPFLPKRGRSSDRLRPLKRVSSSSECPEGISTPRSSRALGSHPDQEVPTANATQSVGHCLVTSPPDTYNVIDLPLTLSWLKTAKPELWIDQEGFRSTRASFRLVGYSEMDRSFGPFQSDIGMTPGARFSPGIADFIPAKRQIFIFHRSALDTPPVLRRLTTEGDDSRDFLSRQASLTLKNGVYTVRGSEASSPLSPVDGHTGSGTASLSPNLPDVKFKWKFDYLVQDRRTKRSGQVMKGEKTLTPLAFSCSPWMLSLQQGKKIKLMHIVKKTVAMNLAAERVEPPLPPLPPSIKLQLHRRARSHTAKENVETAHLPSQGITVSSVLRHRRASSAGASTLMRPVNGRSDIIPARPILHQHILSPRPIAEMMEPSSVSDTKGRQEQHKPGFVSLEKPWSHKKRPAVVARLETYF